MTGPEDDDLRPVRVVRRPARPGATAAPTAAEASATAMAPSTADADAQDPAELPVVEAVQRTRRYDGLRTRAVRRPSGGLVVHEPPAEAEAAAGAALAGEPEVLSADGPPPPRRPRGKRPLYARLLDLRHVHPNAWQRALLGEGSVAAGVVLVLADVASAWTIPVLPLAVAAVVKANDLLAGALEQRASTG